MRLAVLCAFLVCFGLGAVIAPVARAVADLGTPARGDCVCSEGGDGTYAYCGQCPGGPILLMIGCTQCCETNGNTSPAHCSQKDGPGVG
jgi:hypothetical protein